jgi:phosphatidate cytidylyltransferase
VADDKREGDDLFEDLDKFFAPIKDVDWDEPASAGAREVPSEEHVAVRAGESATPAPVEPSRAGEPEASEASEPASPDHDDDDSWYDTSVIDAIEGIDDPGTAPADEVVDVGEIVDEEPEVSEPGIPSPDPHAGQVDLFIDGDDDAEITDEVNTDTAEWSTVGEPGVPAASAQPAFFVDHPEPPGPSEADLEAAAEHFAGSVRDGSDVAPLEGEDDIIEPAGPLVGAALITDEDARDVEQELLADLDPPGGTRTVTVGSEGLGGPSWQEPASVEVGADLDARRGPDGGERDVPAAFLTGVVLVVCALGAILISEALFAVLATFVVLYAQGELYGVMAKRNRQPATAVGLVTGALIMGGAYYHGEAAVLAMFVLGVFATLLWFMAVPAAHRKDTVGNVGLTLMNVAWIPLLAGYLLLTLDLPDGKSLVIAVIGLTFVFDTSAFLGGSIMGGQFFQRPLAPTVSPKKSIEGLIIATLVTVIVSEALVTAFVKSLQEMRIETFMLGLVVSAAATFGDLAESLVKRDLGLKDMGSVLPGHGGVLDRIDSLLFVAPAAFLFFRIVFA